MGGRWEEENGYPLQKHPRMKVTHQLSEKPAGHGGRCSPGGLAAVGPANVQQYRYHLGTVATESECHVSLLSTGACTDGN